MPDAPGLSPGSIFAGDYRVIEPLSAGGMGSVYVAEHRFTGQRCALKLMHPGLVADPALRRRFEQEARIGSRIESDHVVRVVGAGVDADTGVPWLAMELLVGADLSAVVAQRGALEPHVVRAIFEDLCHAAGAAHRAGVVHRDLKPANIFWADMKRARVPFTIKVLDFGIAKVVADAAHLTRGGTSMGTPLWMAPEQRGSAGPVTPASDVWALGLIAFYLLTGRMFWVAANVASASVMVLLQEIVADPIPAASARAAQLGARVPAGFDAWFARCVARDPVARFADADACFRALEPLLVRAVEPNAPGGHVRHAVAMADTQPVAVRNAHRAAGGAITVPAMTEPPTRLARAPLVISIVAALVAVVVAVVAVVLLVPDGDRRSGAPSTAVGNPGACPTEKCLPFQVADPARVDAIDLLPQARKAAALVDPSAELFLISITGVGGDGTVDLTNGSQGLGYNFQARSGAFVLQCSGSRFVVTRFPAAITRAMTEPFCSARVARRAASSRLPRGAAVMNLIQAQGAASPSWQITVLPSSATVDGRTCTLR